MLAERTGVTIEALAWSHLDALRRFPTVNEALYGQRRVTPTTLRQAWMNLSTEQACGHVCAFAVLSQEEGAVGVVRLDMIPERPGVGELGYCIAHSARGRGYATAGAALLLAELVRHEALDWVWAWCSGLNAPSLRVLQKLGFNQAEPPDCPPPSAEPPHLLFELPIKSFAAG